MKVSLPSLPLPFSICTFHGSVNSLTQMMELLFLSNAFHSSFYKLLCQNEVNERELSSLKAVIKCIEDHKIEEQYPLDPLQKRVVQLEKAKADKKRATEAAKPQPKRPRANGVGCGPRPTNIAPADKAPYARATDRYPQYMYDRPYIYSGHADSHGPSLLGSATYGFGHGNYFGNGYQYQAVSYLH